MHSLKYVKDYWRQVFNNISILRILDDEIEFVKNAAFWNYHIKVKKLFVLFPDGPGKLGKLIIYVIYHFLR